MQPWCQEPKDLQEECELEEEVHLHGLVVAYLLVLAEHEDLELLPWLHKPPLHAWPVPHVLRELPQGASHAVPLDGACLTGRGGGGLKGSCTS